jgi:hypothetical protein
MNDGNDEKESEENDDDEDEEKDKNEETDEGEENEEVELYDEENRENFPYWFVRFFVLVHAIIPNKQENFAAYNTEVFIRGVAKQFSWKHIGHELGEEIIHITENIHRERTNYLEYSKYILM